MSADDVLMSLEATTLPGSDLRVSRVALGGNMLGGRLDLAESFALLDAFADEGGRLVDTAAVYADWVPEYERGCSEKTLGRWLRARPGSDLVIATKGGHPPLDDPGRPRLDGAALRSDVEQSLDRLGLSSLPLWLTHRDDPARPVAEIVSELETLRAQGLVRWYGMANWSTRRLVEALDLRAAGGADGFVVTQSALAAVRPRDDVLAPGLVAADAPMLELHRSAGLTLLAYSPQAKGYFDGASGAVDLYDSPQSRQVAAAVDIVARDHGVRPTQVALATLLLVDAPVVPVVGCSSVARLRDVLEAASLDLTPHERTSLLAVLPVGGVMARDAS